MSWLDNFFAGQGIKRVAINGTLLPAESTINFASGMTGSDNPANSRSDVFISIPISGVTAGAYGDSTHVATFTVGADGRVTAASNVAINFPTGFTAGADLAGNGTSTSTAQYVSSLSYSSAAAGGTIAINGTGTALQWAAGNTGPTISQASTSAATGANFTVSPQASSATNGTPGNFVVNLPTHTGTGKDPYVVFSIGGSPLFQFGDYSNVSSLSALWLGNITPSGSNPSFLGDGTSIQFNAASGGIVYFEIATFPYALMSTNGSWQFFPRGGATTTYGGGVQVVGIGACNTVPTSAPANGLALYANAGSPGTLGLVSAGLAFNAVATAAISQDAQTTDTATLGASVQAQSAFATATTNTAGGTLALKSGASQSGNVASLSLASSNTAASCQAQFSAPGGVAGSSANSLPFSWSTTAVSGLASGTTTLTAAQYATPWLVLSGTLSGATTIAFPNKAGFWVVDVSGLSGYSATNTLTFTSGSGTVTVINTATAIPATGSIVLVTTTGANVIKITASFGGSGGGTTAPVTFTRHTNTANSTYTIDTTGGSPDYYIIHNKSGAVSYVWPALTDGRTIIIKDATNAINTPANNIFIVPHGNETFDGAAAFALSGTSYHFTNGSGTVTATSSKFTSELAVGMSIQSSNQSGVNYIVSAIGSDLSLTITPTFGGTTTTTATATRTSLTYETNAGALRMFSDGSNIFTW